jgi:hypothetical protein
MTIASNQGSDQAKDVNQSRVESVPDFRRSDTQANENAATEREARPGAAAALSRSLKLFRNIFARDDGAVGAQHALEQDIDATLARIDTKIAREREALDSLLERLNRRPAA